MCRVGGGGGGVISVLISLLHKDSYRQHDNDSLSLATENFGDAETAWNTWTLHF